MKTEESGRVSKQILYDLEKEMSIVANLQHPHIVEVVGMGREI
jgi:hypothetical protein